MPNNPVQAIDYSERFVNVEFAGLQLLIPQTDVYSLEPVVDMTPAADIGSVGQIITQSGEVWSLYAFSSELNLLSSCPESYRIVILMKNIQPVYGLLCEQVSTILRNDISIHAIPTAVYNEASPLLALALYGGDVRYISSAVALTRLFHG
jgi:hypothetical protein